MEEVENSESEFLHEKERLADLANIIKRINYLAQRKSELQGPIQEMRSKIASIRKEKKELDQVYEEYEF